VLPELLEAQPAKVSAPRTKAPDALSMLARLCVTARLARKTVRSCRDSRAHGAVSHRQPPRLADSHILSRESLSCDSPDDYRLERGAGRFAAGRLAAGGALAVRGDPPAAVEPCSPTTFLTVSHVRVVTSSPNVFEISVMNTGPRGPGTYAPNSSRSSSCSSCAPSSSTGNRGRFAGSARRNVTMRLAAEE